MPQNKVSETVTHVTLNIINRVVHLRLIWSGLMLPEVE